ncbi:hypothetical protein [Shewanella sp. NIFS-20-20]|nr:hypothetical protein [Shewanella sp. NIFS-20-20]MBV7314307.1 hypothetical protein [Shewanella sp. NIFS-20-20]
MNNETLQFNTIEFSAEELESRFEMEVLPGTDPGDEPDWKCTCTIEN